MRSKSDPYLLKNTQTYHRKLDYNHKPKVLSFFMLQQNNDDNKIDDLKVKYKLVPSRKEQEEYLYRYFFDDSDFSEEELPESLIV